ncbi:MAG: ATP-binding protein [Bacteroidota bacterium]
MPDQYPEVIVQFIVSICVAVLMIVFIVVIFQLYRKKKLLQEKEVENLKTAFEKELLQTRLEIQEDVLKNVSMEIHDNIGQIMLLAKVNISILQTMPLPEAGLELIKDTKGMLTKASEDISQLSRSLNSDRITDIGVFAAMTHELKLMQQKKLFNIFIPDPMEITGKKLPKETQLLVFRMFQEISNNIIKHAAATLVTFSIDQQNNGYHLQLEDNGKGFAFTPSPAGQSNYNGVGLRSLQSRVNLFKGTIRIESILGKGTTIAIFIPTGPDNDPIP